MKTPIDRVREKIVKAENGYITLVAPYDDWFTLTKRGYKEAYVELIDSRKVSDKQRRMCFALIGEIAEWQGQSRSETAKDLVNEARTLDFLINELGENADKLFSLSDAPMSLVAAYQRYLIRFVIYNGIPTKRPLYEYADDITDYIYSCLIKHKCAVCGRYADLHHIDRVGIGRDRHDIIHEGMEAIPLCREHHGEIHTTGDKTFMERYHFDGGIELDKTLCRIYKLKSK